MNQIFLLIFWIILSGSYADPEAKCLVSGEEKGLNEKGRKNSFVITGEDLEWMHNATVQQLKGCRVKGQEICGVLHLMELVIA